MEKTLSEQYRGMVSWDSEQQLNFIGNEIEKFYYVLYYVFFQRQSMLLWTLSRHHQGSYVVRRWLGSSCSSTSYVRTNAPTLKQTKMLWSTVSWISGSHEGPKSDSRWVIITRQICIILDWSGPISLIFLPLWFRIRYTTHATVPFMAMISYKFLHITTAQLSCHVQKFEGISSLWYQWEYNQSSMEF